MTLVIMHLVWLVVATILCTSLAQVFQKRLSLHIVAARAKPEENGAAQSTVPAAREMGQPLAMISYLFASAFLLGLGLALWCLVLGRLPVSLAYPLLSLNVVLVVGLSIVLFDEKVNKQQGIGLATILAGVALIAAGGSW